MYIPYLLIYVDISGQRPVSGKYDFALLLYLPAFW